ncbi:MAG: lipopolysaccharide biosynthesis protein, partial [Bacteroidota bacterium]
GLFYLGILDFKGFLQFYIIAFAAPAVIMFGYLLKTGEFSLQGSFKNMKTVLRKDIVNVALFGIISGFSRIAILNIDKYMVNHFLDLNATGIYAIAFFFGSMILVPGRALRRISSTVISEAHKSKDNNKMYDVYEKSSLSMFTVGAGLFVLIWGNINNIFNILPDVYETGKWVIFFIGLAYVINMLSGIGNQIILYSKYYRHHSFIMLGALVLIVTLNIVLIPVYGMNGAAMATFLTILAERLFKWWFVYKRFGMQPYHSKHIMILLASVVIYFVSRLIPSMSLIPDIIIRSALIIGLFLVFSKTFKVSLELNAVIDKLIQMASGKKKK